MKQCHIIVQVYSSQEKWDLISSKKDFVHKLLYELLITLRLKDLKKLENTRKIPKLVEGRA